MVLVFLIFGILFAGDIEATDKLEAYQMNDIPNDWQLLKQIRNEVWKNSSSNYWDQMSCQQRYRGKEQTLGQYFFECQNDYSQRCQKLNDRFVLEQLQISRQIATQTSTLLNCQMKPIIRETWKTIDADETGYKKSTAQIPGLFFYQFDSQNSSILIDYQLSIWDEQSSLQNKLEMMVFPSVAGNFKSVFIFNGIEFFKFSQYMLNNNKVQINYDFPLFNNSYKMVLTFAENNKIPVSSEFFIFSKQYKQVDLMKFRSDLNGILYIPQHFGILKSIWQQLASRLMLAQ